MSVLNSTNRRAFLRHCATAAAAVATAPMMTRVALLAESPAQAGPKPAAPPTPTRAAPGPDEFVFARLRYDSGDWDYNPKVAANMLDAIVQYTKIPVYAEEIVISADSDDLCAFPFLFMTGHKLVRFTTKERENLVRYVDAGGLLFSDDCNHDVNGLYAKSFEEEMTRTFPADALGKLPKAHPLYHSFFAFPDGPPQTVHELNGWGDDIVHDYLRAIERHGRIGVLYSNKDYGCQWDYDWHNKRFRTEDDTKFAVNIAVYAMT